MRLAFKIIVAEFFRIKKEDKVYVQIKSSRTHYQLANENSIGTSLWAHYTQINEIPLLLWYKDWKTLGCSEIMCRVRIKNLGCYGNEGPM